MDQQQQHQPPKAFINMAGGTPTSSSSHLPGNNTVNIGEMSSEKQYLINNNYNIINNILPHQQQQAQP
jgi:hypothetical protein